MSEEPFTDERYDVLEPLGSGGMATVYKGRHRASGALRAIKVLDKNLSHRTEVLKRFANEAATMDRLSHPNIVPLHDVSLEGDQPFIVMDFIDGESLLDRVQGRGLDAKQAAKLLVPVLDALQTAHDNGIVHRDIKPHNILISRANEVFVTDFGIARCTDEADTSLTRTGMVMGTWAFMAPEQRADAKGVDHLADIYSVGATLFAAVTGETPKDLFAAELDPSLYKGVPKPLEAVIRRACAYWTTDRYPSAEAMKADLELTISMMGEGKAIKDHSQVSFRTDPGSHSPGPPPPPIPPTRVRTGAPAAHGSPRVVSHAPTSSSGTGRGVFIALGAAVIVLVGLMGWMVSSTLDSVSDEDAVVVAEIPSQKRKGRMGSAEMERVEALKPAIDHDARASVVLGEDYRVVAEIPGSGMYDRVQAWYRPTGQAEWSRAGLRKVGDGYEGSITTTRLFADGLEYWIEAKPYTEGMPTLKVGSAKQPIRVDVVLD